MVLRSRAWPQRQAIPILDLPLPSPPPAGAEWIEAYRVDPDAIVIAEMFAKKTAQTPNAILEACRRRLKEYDDA